MAKNEEKSTSLQLCSDRPGFEHGYPWEQEDQKATQLSSLKFDDFFQIIDLPNQNFPAPQIRKEPFISASHLSKSPIKKARHQIRTKGSGRIGELEEGSRQHQLERNRLAAAKCRIKKKALQQQMQAEIERLRRENACLVASNEAWALTCQSLATERDFWMGECGRVLMSSRPLPDVLEAEEKSSGTMPIDLFDEDVFMFTDFDEQNSVGKENPNNDEKE